MKQHLLSSTSGVQVEYIFCLVQVEYIDPAWFGYDRCLWITTAHSRVKCCMQQQQTIKIHNVQCNACNSSIWLCDQQKLGRAGFTDVMCLIRIWPLDLAHI